MDDFEGDPARQRRFEGAQRLSGAVDIFCNLPSPNRTRIDFGGGDLVGGVDQRVVAMVGAGASKGNRTVSSSLTIWVSCSTPQKSQHPGTVKCACSFVHVVTELCMLVTDNTIRNSYVENIHQLID